jgi:hypothetical protein
MKPKIKFRLEVWENILLFQILEMDERFRCDSTEKDPKQFKARNGVVIASSVVPGLYIGKEVYLHGAHKASNKSAVSINMVSREKAEEYKEEILEALADWAENWEGWSEEDKSEKEPGVYEF